VVALRIAAGSAAFADRLGLIPALIPRWPGTGDPGGSPLYTMTGLNARAIVALHAGDTAQARELIAQQAIYGSAGELRLAAAHGQMLVGLSHLRDGDPVQAESVLGPRLAEAEAEKRRSTIACLYASVLAAALLDRDQPVAAQTVLANRLDVIERCGFPDNILCAYRALAYVAAGQGDARRALKVLDGLEAIARRRKLPRLYAHALAEQIRIHALGTRMDTVDRLECALEGLAGEFDEAATLPLQREYRLVLALAKVHAALARGELEQADRQLQAAGTLATAMHRRHDVQRTQVLRAVAARLRGDGQALPLLKEANLLADFAGHARLLTDTHPLAVQMLDELESAAGTKPTAIGSQDDAEVASSRPVAQGPELFTSKEAEILDLLDRGLPNKLIATTLDVSGETVKWHLKNVYLKLSVGSRRHAVERARLLGLLPEERQRYGVMARRTGS
jgi:LuxR family maltose regulon positive regulatory protein